MPTENFDSKLEDCKEGRIDLLDFLELLPDEKERSFELYLTKLVEETPDIQKQLIKVLEQSEALSEKILFSAFYGLCIFYRRMKEFTKLDRIISKYEVQYDSKPMFNHILALSLKSKGGIENIEEAIAKAKISAELVKNNAGVFHNYAEVIATAMEEDIIKDPAQIDDAIEYVKKAISLAPKYAKYYCTYGRLLGLKDQTAKGVQLIRKAIDLEDSMNNDYAIRIGDYQAFHSRLIFKQYTDRLQEKIDEFETKIIKTKDDVTDLAKSSMAKNLEFLGFFAALVSFIIASIQILSKQPFDKAIQLIIVLNGCLLCAFAGFFGLIHGSDYLLRIVIIFMLGAAMIAFALLSLPKLILIGAV